MARKATAGAAGRESRSPDVQKCPCVTSSTLVNVLARMRDRTGGPRTRYRLLALLVVVGMLLTAAPLLISIVSSLLGGLRG